MSDCEFYDEMTLKEAKALLQQLVEENDSKTCCPCCDKRARNDKKGITRWQVEALCMMAEWSLVNPGKPIHAASVLKNTDAARDHGVALLRHWGFIKEVKRPADAPKKQKGSRGLTGYYEIEDEGWRVLQNGERFKKNIHKPFGSATWETCGSDITLVEAMDSKLNTDENENVIDGTTGLRATG